MASLFPWHTAPTWFTALCQEISFRGYPTETGPNQAAETFTDGRCTKSPFISVATPLGSLVSTKIKNKIWGNEYIDLGLLLSVQPSNETYGVKLQKIGEDNLLPQFLTRKCCQSPT